MDNLIFLAGGGNNLKDAAIIPSVNLTVTHSMENSLSKYPIEKSPDGAYNAVVRNNVISVTGAFSDIHLPSVLFENSTPDVLTATDDTKNRPQAAFDLISSARNNLTYMDIVTGYQTYKDCLITSFNVKEDKDTGGLLSYELTFEQPRFTTAKTVLTANIIKPLEADGATNEKGGVQEKQELADLEEQCKDGFFSAGLCITGKTLFKSSIDTDPAILEENN